MDFFWGPGFGVDQDDAATVVLTVSARLADAAPTNVVLEVPQTHGE